MPRVRRIRIGAVLVYPVLLIADVNVTKLGIDRDRLDLLRDRLGLLLDRFGLLDDLRGRDDLV